MASSKKSNKKALTSARAQSKTRKKSDASQASESDHLPVHFVKQMTAVMIDVPDRFATHVEAFHKYQSNTAQTKTPKRKPALKRVEESKKSKQPEKTKQPPKTKEPLPKADKKEEQQQTEQTSRKRPAAPEPLPAKRTRRKESALAMRRRLREEALKASEKFAAEHSPSPSNESNQGTPMQKTDPPQQPQEKEASSSSKSSPTVEKEPVRPKRLSAVAMRRLRERQSASPVATTVDVETTIETIQTTVETTAVETITSPPARPVINRARQKLINEAKHGAFEPSDENVVAFKVDGEPHLCIALKKDEIFAFSGMALIAPLMGAVQINGSVCSAPCEVTPNLTQDTFSAPDSLDFWPVFSPHSHARITLKATAYGKASAKKGAIPSKVNVDWVSLLAKLCTSQTKAILVIKSLAWCGLSDIGRFIDFKDVFALNQPHTYAPVNSIPGFQFEQYDARDSKFLTMPPKWEKMVEQEIQARMGGVFSAVVCGPQGCGKSTFSRFLVNRLLNVHKRVAFIETDLGQAELAPAGIVTLHILEAPLLGPPFTHQHIRPTRSVFLGSLSQKENPGYYLDGIAELVKTWQQQYEDVPLVINTSGWITSLGFDLLISLVRDANPHSIFQFCVPIRENNIASSFEASVTPMGGTPRTVYKLDSILAAPEEQDPRRSIDCRTLTTLSYFYQDREAFGQPHRRWWRLDRPLTQQPPWQLAWKGLEHIWHLYEDVHPDQLLYSLNGTVVALFERLECETQEQDEDEAEQKRGTMPMYTSGAYSTPPAVRSTSCIGLGIVRAVDQDKQALHILSPLPQEELEKVYAVARGRTVLPLGCFRDLDDPNWADAPYVTTDYPFA